MKLLLITIILSNIFYSQSKTEAYKAFNEKNYKKAADLFDDIYEDDEDDLDALFHLGQSYYLLNNFEDAFETFSELIEEEDENVDYYRWYLKAFNSYNKMQDYATGKKIMNAFYKVAKLDPDDLDGERNLIYVLYKFPKAIGGDKKKSFRLLSKMEKDHPFDAKLLEFQLYMISEDIDKALKLVDEIETYTERKIDYYSIYNVLGYYYLGKKNMKMALNSFKKQIELAPDKANSYDSLGDGYKAAGDIKNARIAYKKALEIDSSLKSSKDKLKKLD